MAVLARADVAGRVQRVAAERARRPAGADDPEGAFDEGPGRIGAEADAEDIGSIVILVVDLDDGLALFLLDLVTLGPRLDQDLLGVAIPAERQRRRPECLVEGLVERVLVRLDRLRGVLDDAPAVELDEELAEPVREHRHLGLLQADADHPAAIAGLQEEAAAAGLADGSGGESIGEVEDEEATRHGLTVPGFGQGSRRQRPVPAMGAAGPQPTFTRIVWWPRAPSGAGFVRSSVWTSPLPSVARTSITCEPAAASQS
jgi:hypothetical protein